MTKVNKLCRIATKFFADLVTFTEEIYNGKLHFLCSALVLLHSWSWYVEIFWCFSKFLLSPQVKQKVIISDKYGI